LAAYESVGKTYERGKGGTGFLGSHRGEKKARNSSRRNRTLAGSGVGKREITPGKPEESAKSRGKKNVYREHTPKTAIAVVGGEKMN
jgi:hypothetical protein